MNKKCVICGFNAKKVTENWFQCEYCGHIESMQKEKPGTYDEVYKQNYVRWHKAGYDQIKQAVQWELIARYAPDVKTLLEVGCGNGYFLDAIPPELNIKVTGYDKYIGEYQNERVLDGKYDMVAAFHTLEHLEDPKALINRTRHKYFIFTIPWAGEATGVAFAGVLMTFFGHAKPGEHKQLFTKKSLDIFLRDYTLLCEDYSDGYVEGINDPKNIVTQIRKRN